MAKEIPPRQLTELGLPGVPVDEPTWTCPHCGSDKNPISVPDCGSCGREGVRPEDTWDWQPIDEEIREVLMEIEGRTPEGLALCRICAAEPIRGYGCPHCARLRAAERAAEETRADELAQERAEHPPESFRRGLR